MLMSFRYNASLPPNVYLGGGLHIADNCLLKEIQANHCREMHINVECHQFGLLLLEFTNG